jgi:putative aldouronate transport system substrate-binding protein
MKRKALLLIMAVLMLLPMAGCQSSPKPSAVPTQAAATATADGSAAATTSTTPAGTATTKLPDAEFTYFIPDQTAKIPPDDAPVMKQIYDLTGVRIKRVIPPADPMERLNVMLATNDLTDLILFNDPTVMKQFIDAGKILRLNELLQQNCPNVLAVNWKQFENRLYDEKGNLYFMPNGYNISGLDGALPETTAGLNVRTAYFEENGYDKLPKTLDELGALLATIKTKYPAMVPMSLALGTDGQLNDLIYIAASAFGLEESDRLIRSNGKLSYFTQSPEIKQFFAFLNGLNVSGLLDRESPVLSTETLKQKCVAGKVWSYIGNGWEINSEVIAYEMGKNSKEVMLGQNFIKGNSSVQKTTYTRGTLNLYTTGLTVTTKCADPARFMKFYDYCNTEEGRINLVGTVDWNFTGDNTIERTKDKNLIVQRDKEIIPGRPVVNFSAWTGDKWHTDENWWWNWGVECMYDFTFYTGNYPNGKYDIMGDGDVSMWWNDNTTRINKAAYNISGTDYWPWMRTMAIDTSEYAQLQLDPKSDEYADKLAIENLYAKELPRAIMAKSADAFEAEWSAMNAEMEKEGLQAYITKVNELYSARLQQWNSHK